MGVRQAATKEGVRVMACGEKVEPVFKPEIIFGHFSEGGGNSTTSRRMWKGGGGAGHFVAGGRQLAFKIKGDIPSSKVSWGERCVK